MVRRRSVLEIDRASGARRSIVTLPGFVRGLAVHEGYFFVGLSLMRDSKPFEGLPVERLSSARPSTCSIVSTRTNSIASLASAGSSASSASVTYGGLLTMRS